MNKDLKKLREKMRNEIDDGITLKAETLSEKIDWDVVKSNANVAKNEKKRSSKRVFAWAMSAVAAVFVLVASIASISLFVPNTAPLKGYSLTISINPSISLQSDENDVVVKQSALNADGVKLLFGVDLVGMTMEAAVPKVVELAEKFGYMTSQSVIKINVKGSKKNVKAEKEKSEKVINSLNSYLNSINKGFDVSRLDEDELENILSTKDEAALKDFAEQLKNKYAEELLNSINQKIQDTNALAELLKTYNYSSDRELIIAAVNEYSLKYEFEKDKINSQKDVEKAIEELAEIAEELEEIREKLNSNEPIDDFKDFIEDLKDAIDETIKGNDKHDKNDKDDNDDKHDKEDIDDDEDDEDEDKLKIK